MTIAGDRPGRAKNADGTTALEEQGFTL